MAAGVAAAGLGSMALGAISSIKAGEGAQAEQEFLAKRDERAAELGRLRSAQTDVAMREELNTTLANIDAVRAAASIDPTSPTTAAIKEAESVESDRQRDTKVTNILAQAREDDETARYRYQAGRDALLAGYLGAGGKVLKGFSSLGASG